MVSAILVTIVRPEDGWRVTAIPLHGGLRRRMHEAIHRIGGTMTMEDLLPGDTALITGAANGIGRATAAALAAEGARAVLADFNRHPPYGR
jgi:NADPH:quinone reductase-like Zn-dependent oxidoreductase